ncbi:MAG: HAD-IC family P-type ATPase [Chthoniobacter sp.]|uniref:HAD-IC family P-type ATPase n=1 Tax=Chthoniobacter sp. TaxID=2510640 RepID=UPI0032A9B13F
MLVNEASLMAESALVTISKRLKHLTARCRLFLRQPRVRFARKLVVAVVGGSVVLVGVVMIILPGPAILVIPLGLAILATEFLWARRWLIRARALLPGTDKPAPPAPVADRAWHQLPTAEIAQFLRVNLSAGLSARDAAQRLFVDGPNELKEGERISPLRILLGQFKSLIIWILIAAGIVSSVLGEAVDAIAILVIVVLNAAIGFYQEYNAEKSIAALKTMTAPQAKVWRDGHLALIPALEIVTGDLLALEAGDLVAADARLLEAASLKCVESALTGESEVVTKQPATLGQGDISLGDRGNMVFMGTSVAAGTGLAVVVATGMKTELGHIAKLMDDGDAKQGTPLQRKLDSFGRILVWAALGIVALLFGLGMLRGTKPFELFMTSISLAVAAVPEGLPAVVTVALSLGVLRMARRRALMRKLAAVETLGSTSVICTDKTGTLTVGEMTVRSLYVAGQCYQVTGEGYAPAGEVRFEGTKVGAPHFAPLLELATILLGCNNAHLVEEDGTWKTVGDPTEGALLVAGLKAGGDRKRIESELPKQHEIPFDSDRKRSTVIRRMPDGAVRALINGAPDALLQRCAKLYTSTGTCPLTEQDRERISAESSAMAKQALRVLGSAYRDLEDASSADFTADAVEHDLVFVGLSGMYDPPRPEGKAAIAKCRDAGIRVVMITGDHPQTAGAIAHDLGIESTAAAVTGAELEKMSDEVLQRRASEVAVYARVTAAHKLRIICALQANDEVVAMTGDGVNDAPAIKRADIGIAMGKSGTEVTKQAADMIITDDNFATIIAAIEEGRGIYDNIRKTLQYLLAGNTGELLLMTTCVIVGLPSPLLPIHLLWINLVTDGLPALCLATDPIDPDVMKRHPRHRSENITDRGFLPTMLFTGFLTAGVAFAVYFYMLKAGTAEEMARTYAFTVLVFAELLRAFGDRSETKPVWRISFFGNINLVVVVVISFGIQVLSHQNAMLGRFLKTSFLPVGDGLVLLAIGAIPLLVLEIEKAGRQAWRRAWEKSNSSRK